MALNSLFCADVPLSNYSLTVPPPSNSSPLHRGHYGGRIYSHSPMEEM